MKDNTTPHKEEKGWEESFDKTFGKDGPDHNSDSIGRKAGCDDCFCNIKERQEHKNFIRSLLSSHNQELIERLEESKEIAKTTTQFMNRSRFNEGLDEAITIIKQKEI